MAKVQSVYADTNPDLQLLQEIVTKLSEARAKVWEAKRAQADVVYDATKFVYERGWYDCLKIDETRMRRMLRR